MSSSGGIGGFSPRGGIFGGKAVSSLSVVLLRSRLVSGVRSSFVRGESKVWATSGAVPV